MSTVKVIKAANEEKSPRPSREEAEEAVKTLIRWAGDNPARAGLTDTPGRVTRAYEEFFAGYDLDPAAVLSKNFEDIAGYEDFVLVRDISFISHCEHHIVPITGIAHVAYWPGEHVVGISKLARLVDIYAKRLISQEIMTLNILNALDKHLKPKGSAVLINAVHHCMSTRGVAKADSATVTSMYSGVFREDEALKKRFLEYIR